MFCKTKIRHIYKTEREFEEVRLLLDCHKPKFVQNTQRQIGYEGGIKNLSISFYPDRREVICKNSIHKFWKGTNSGIFTREEIKEAISNLSELLKARQSQMYFYSTEFAANLSQLRYDTAKYLFQPISYRGKPFFPAQPPWGTNKILERYCSFCDRKIKFYDQGRWLKILERRDIGRDQLRYEEVFHRAKPIQQLLNRSALPVNLLYDKAILSQFSAHLLKVYQAIDKLCQLDYSPYERRQIELLIAGQNPIYWDAMKSRPASRRKARNEYFRLKKSAAAHDDISSEIERKIKEQLALILQ